MRLAEASRSATATDLQSILKYFRPLFAARRLSFFLAGRPRSCSPLRSPDFQSFAAFVTVCCVCGIVWAFAALEVGGSPPHLDPVRMALHTLDRQRRRCCFVHLTKEPQKVLPRPALSRRDSRTLASGHWLPSC